MNEKIYRWIDDIRRARCSAGVDQMDYPDDVVLALIEVESGGDEFARRTNSQFCGLLQMGALAGQDVGFAQRGRDTTTALLGDGPLAILKFLEYQERYAARHDYQPDRIALLWKAGPGTARKVADLLARGAPIDEAIKKGAASVPNTEEYIRRFRDARARWAAEGSCC